jgi:signal transduction histidine kinase
VGVLRRSRWMASLIAVLLTVSVSALRLLGKGALGDDSPFLFYFSALSLASWYGGFLPGALSTVLGGTIVAVFILPVVTPGGIEGTHLIHLAVFTATGILISVLMEKLHNALNRSYRAEQQLEFSVRERTAELAQANTELTAEKNKLLGILDQMREGVYIVNPQFGLDYVNPAMAREFGAVNNQTCYQYTCGPEAGICPWCNNESVFNGKSVSTEWASPLTGKVYDCFEAPIVVQNGIVCKLKILHEITGIRKTEQELLSNHHEIQRLSSELLTAQERERLRISRELHDELGQSLTLIKLKIGLVELNLDEAHKDLKKYCQDASAHVDQSIENMRRISRDLSPAAIETLGLTIALRRLAEDSAKAGKIQLKADIDEVDHLLPLQSGILLYRILQEGFNNIVKHSGAGFVSIAIKKSEGFINFDLKDDGTGFDPEKVDSIKKTATGGFGLTIMKERVRTLGGFLEIQSRNGTRLCFSIPFQSEETQ